jgi:DNA-directed RNA polymerase specialized sigma24 family protein
VDRVGGQRDSAFVALTDSERKTLLRAARLLTGDWAAANQLMDETVGWALTERPPLTGNRGAGVRVRQRMVSAYVADARAGAGSARTGMTRVAEEPSETHSTPETPSLLAGLAVLSAEHRAIVVARYYLALSAAEIAEVLDLDDEHVRRTAAGLVKALQEKAEGAGEQA